jgi:hypothetical protein
MRVKPWLKTSLKGAFGLLALAALGLGGYVYVQTSAYDASMAKVYDVPIPTIVRSSELEVLARGKHLCESVAPCATRSCHGTDLGGGNPLEVGPIGSLTGPNLSKALLSYSDGEVARLMRHGIKKDGRSVTFMPVQDFAWLPDDDVTAVISYLRTTPVVERADGLMKLGTLGKVLDRRGEFAADVARRIDHGAGVRPKGATPTVEYGRFLAMGCQGCHGEHFSGGHIPGAPSSIPIPLNLTPDATGLRDWSIDDLNTLLNTGMRKSGKKLDPFMPYEAFGKYDDTERKALWNFLRSLPPLAFGNR